LSAQEIVNWVTTADGCVHTADATKQFRRVGVGGVHWALLLCYNRELKLSWVWGLTFFSNKLYLTCKQ